MVKTSRALSIAFDVLRGVILGLLLCYGIVEFAQVGTDDLVFRYVGY